MKIIPLLRNAWRAAFTSPLRFVIITAAAALIAAMCASAAVRITVALDRVNASVEPQDGSIARISGPGLTASEAYSLLDVPGVMAVALEVPVVTVTAGGSSVTAKGKVFSEGYLPARRRELVAGSLTPPGHGQPYCHLGLNVALGLYGTASAAVGHTVEIDGVAHEVRAVIGRVVGAADPPPEPKAVVRFVVSEGRVNDTVAFSIDSVQAYRGNRLLVIASPGNDSRATGRSALSFLLDRSRDRENLTLSVTSNQARGLDIVGGLGRILGMQCALTAIVTLLNMLAFCLYWSYDRRGEAAIHAALGCSPVQARLSAACEVAIPAMTGWLIGTAYSAMRYGLVSGGVQVAAMWGGSTPVPGLVLASAMSGAAAGAVAVGICVAIALGRRAACVSPAELLRAAR